MVLIKNCGSSKPYSLISSLILTASSKCFLLRETLKEAISCFIFSSSLVCLASLTLDSFSLLACSWADFLASASFFASAAYCSASAFSFFSASSLAFFSDSTLALASASASALAFFSASALALIAAFFYLWDSTLTVANEISGFSSDFSSWSPLSNCSRLSLFFSVSMAASASICCLTLSIWS
jgi:hypothetical protein